MAGVFDQLIFLWGPLVLGNEFFFVIEGDLLVVGLEGEPAGGIGKRDAVAISFKLDQGLRGALHRQDEAGIIIGFGQRSQKGLFLLGKDVPGSFPGGSVNPAVGHTKMEDFPVSGGVGFHRAEETRVLTSPEVKKGNCQKGDKVDKLPRFAEEVEFRGWSIRVQSEKRIVQSRESVIFYFAG